VPAGRRRARQRSRSDRGSSARRQRTPGSAQHCETTTACAASLIPGARCAARLSAGSPSSSPCFASAHGDTRPPSRRDAPRSRPTVHDTRQPRPRWMPRRRPRSLRPRQGSSSPNEDGAAGLHGGIDCPYELQHGARVNDPEPGRASSGLSARVPLDSSEAPYCRTSTRTRRASPLYRVDLGGSGLLRRGPQFDGLVDERVIHDLLCRQRPPFVLRAYRFVELSTASSYGHGARSANEPDRDGVGREPSRASASLRYSSSSDAVARRQRSPRRDVVAGRAMPLTSGSRPEQGRPQWRSRPGPRRRCSVRRRGAT
jgi:hypothetical protein